jgi:ferrous iron transport protein B
MELPPYHVPTVKGVALHTWFRLRAFALRAGKVILVVVVVMSFLGSIGTDGSFGHRNQTNSVLAEIGRAIVPVFRPMGIRRDNWPAAVGLFNGVFAKEAVVGTLNSLYTQMDADGPAGPGRRADFNLWERIGDAFKTIPANLRSAFGGGVLRTLLDPFGFSGATAEEPEEVEASTYVAMRKYFDGAIGAYAYLLFVLIYAPCVAAMAAIYRETNLRWTLFIVGYLTALAWMVAVGFYQAATIGRHVGSSLAWLAGLVAAFGGYVLVLKLVAARLKRNAENVAEE